MRAFVIFHRGRRTLRLCSGEFDNVLAQLKDVAITVIDLDLKIEGKWVNRPRRATRRRRVLLNIRAGAGEEPSQFTADLGEAIENAPVPGTPVHDLEDDELNLAASAQSL